MSGDLLRVVMKRFEGTAADGQCQAIMVWSTAELSTNMVDFYGCWVCLT